MAPVAQAVGNHCFKAVTNRIGKKILEKSKTFLCVTFPTPGSGNIFVQMDYLMFHLIRNSNFVNVTVICPALNLQWAMVGATHPCFHATYDAGIARIGRIDRIDRIDRIGRIGRIDRITSSDKKCHLLALPFISGVTSCWSRVEREGRQETRWEL